MLPDLRYIAAPMVNQSDLPFRALAGKYGSTTVYTQMLMAERLLNDQEYFDFHRRDLQYTTNLDADHHRPVIVQLAGDDPDTLVNAARTIQDLCDGIDINLGCPQEAAREKHYGAYLLSLRDWPLVESMVSSLSTSLIVPVSAKLRLCQPVTKTVELAQRIEASGAAWITLHARTVSARRRRQGAADLGQVKALKEAITIPVISNGNVREFGDIAQNLGLTGADGVMVGETLLGNPCLFSGVVLDPIEISQEYLELCERYPTATVDAMKAHVKHFIDFGNSRAPWASKLKGSLAGCQSSDNIITVLSQDLERLEASDGSLARADALTSLEDCNIDLLHY